MKILVVENGTRSAGFLKKGLAENGFVVDGCGSGEEAIYLAREFFYNVIVMNVRLPDRSVWSVLSDLRQARVHSAILLLSERNDVEDKVKGLNLGADDYLVRPFAFSELLARIHALLRRERRLRRDHISVSDLRVDLLHHRVYRGGQPLYLTPKEYALVSLLADRAGEVLSRTEIAEQVWDMNYDCGTNVVAVHIRRLRSKLDEPFQKKLIHTVRGFGYVLEERSDASVQKN